MEPSSTEGGAEEKLVRSLPHKVILKHGQELEEEQEELAEHQPLEQEDLNFERWKRRPIPQRTLHQKIDDLKTYLWNAETNEFMGRSGKSWSELTKKEKISAVGLWGWDILYHIFFLVHMTITTLLMLSATQLIILNNMQIHNHLLSGFLNQRPAPGRALQRFIYALLSLSFSLPVSLCSVLSAYNDAAQQRKNIPCDKETYFMQDDLDEAAERKACQFKRSWLGQCSGLQDPNFGYSQGRPCILLRMNRVKKDGFGVQQGANVQVQCKLNGKGIINDSPTDRYLGSVTFSLEVGA
ncbi:protein ATP1B4 [Neolamprologus brichardi]|uniref:protein ATP1B4 n=1 Tax=Neolamprologus brichardi TaxID=32507 RepID=UPI0003EBF88B|nr:protein ATP1B4 [Neolamprologus brichardi]